MSKFKFNAKEVIGDFREYSEKTQKSMRASMAYHAHILAGEQKIYAYNRIKNSETGLLGSAMRGRRSKEGKNTWEAGPVAEDVVYAWYIEAGASESQKARGNTFAGYHYVRDTFGPRVKKVERSLKRLIKKHANK